MKAGPGQGWAGFKQGVGTSFTGYTPIIEKGGTLAKLAQPSPSEMLSRLTGGEFSSFLSGAPDLPSGAKIAYNASAWPGAIMDLPEAAGPLQMVPRTPLTQVNYPIGPADNPNLVMNEHGQFFDSTTGAEVPAPSSLTRRLTTNPSNISVVPPKQTSTGSWSFGDVLPENMGQTLQQAFPGAESAYTVPGGETLYGPAADAAARAEAIKTTLQSLGGVRPTAADLIKAGDKAVAAIQPGILQKWGTVGALGAGAMALGGGFEEAKEEDVVEGDRPGFVETETGVDLLAEDPERYVVQNLTPYSDAYNRLLAERLGGAGGVAYAARGGGVNHFPRRTGHIRGPGTPTSDDVPAMLSDGEFVMTKRAVDGAGGPNNMYKMMRNFEMKT